MAAAPVKGVAIGGTAAKAARAQRKRRLNVTVSACTARDVAALFEARRPKAPETLCAIDNRRSFIPPRVLRARLPALLAMGARAIS